MAAHAAIRLLAQRPAAEGVEIDVELACGCAVTRVVAADRVLERADGTPFVAGKYACPAGHDVSVAGRRR